MPLRIRWFPGDCRQIKICMKQTFELVGFTACSHGSRMRAAVHAFQLGACKRNSRGVSPLPLNGAERSVAWVLEWAENQKRREDLATSGNITVPVEPWDKSESGKVTILDILVHGIGKPLDRVTAGRPQSGGSLPEAGGMGPKAGPEQGP